MAGALAVVWLAPSAVAQGVSESRVLPSVDYRDGDQTLNAFAPVSAATRYSIVKLNVDGGTVALGTVVGTNGLALTKASELKPGRLTCWLAGGREVPAERLGVDEDDDLALVRVQATDLKPITWATENTVVGQWAVTPGIEETPFAVGIISALPRQIRFPRALIGVQFDFATSQPKIALILAGMGAEKAGLTAGDLIVAVNNAAVTNREQVVERLREFHDGQTVTLRVERAARQFDVAVRMTALPTDEEASTSRFSERFNHPAGEVSRRANGFTMALQHDTVLPPWLCGGPLVDLDGKAIGINIARASRVATFALPPDVVKRALAKLEPAPAPAVQAAR